MSKPQDKIIVKKMLFYGRHGIEEHELIRRQPFLIDVEMSLDLRPPAKADDLSLTVDYTHVPLIVRDVVEGKSFKLLEALAETIAERLLSELKVEELVVRISKPKVAERLSLGGIEIVVHRRRE